MRVMAHPATLIAATIIGAISAAASVDFETIPADPEPVVAGDMLMERGWPYFDKSWSIRGVEHKQVSRIVTADNETQAEREARLRDLALRGVQEQDQ